LYAGHPPFEKAHTNDTYYKLLLTNRADLFWKNHSRSKPANFFSEDFKDLVTNMLQHSPNMRLGLVDIVGHPWMQGEIASDQEIHEEFVQRHAIITKQQEAQQAQANAKKEVNRGAQDGVYMGETEESKDAVDIRELYKFDESTFLAKSTALYTLNDAQTIKGQLKSAFQDLDASQEAWNEKKWKCTFELRRDLTDEDKEDAVLKNQPQFCRVQMKMLKMDDERICVEFTRLDGDSMFFFESVKEIKTKNFRNPKKKLWVGATRNITQVQSIFHHISSLDYADCPDYNLIHDQLVEMYNEYEM